MVNFDTVEIEVRSRPNSEVNFSVDRLVLGWVTSPKNVLVFRILERRRGFLSFCKLDISVGYPGFLIRGGS